MLERRENPRYILEKELPLTFKHQNSLITGKMISASKLGVYAKVNNSLPISERVALDVKFSKTKNIKLKGRTIWGDDKNLNYGIDFTEFQDDLPAYWLGFFQGMQNVSDRRMKERRSSRKKVNAQELRWRDRRENYPIFLKIKKMGRYKNLEAQDAFSYFREFEKSEKSYIKKNGVSFINFGSNNYLGITFRDEIKKTAIDYIQEHGVSLCGTRILSANRQIHRNLESKLARFKKTDASIVFSSGYTANVAVVSTIANNNDFIVMDEKAHASIIDGCMLSKAKLIAFKHNDMKDLEKKLKKIGKYSGKIIITEGVFSMDGDLGDLPGITSLAEEYNAPIIVDDAHGLGVVGEHGRGTAEHFGLEGKISLSTGTLNKSIGAIGGFVAGSKDIVYALKNFSRPHIFTTSLPAHISACIITALDIIEDNPSLVKNLQTNFTFLKNELINKGYKATNTESAIVPVIIGDEAKAHKMAKDLENSGIFLNAACYPGVKRKEERLRISVMATHTIKELKYLIDELDKLALKYGGIKL